MKRVTLFILCLLFCITVNAFAVDKAPNIAPKHSIEKIIQLSKDYAVKEGFDLKEYFIDQVEYDSTKDEWVVFFQGNVPAPGHHFLIFYYESTDKIELHRGQ